MLCHVLEAALHGGLSPVLLVLGNEAGPVLDAVRAHGLEQKVIVVDNPEFASGQSTSLRVGVDSVPKSCDGAMFLLGDQPLVRAHTVRLLANAFAREPERWVAPIHDGRRGNPVVAPCAWFKRIRELHGDTGPREYLQQKEARLLRVEVDDPGVIHDVDTPEEYAALESLI